MVYRMIEVEKAQGFPVSRACRLRSPQPFSGSVLTQLADELKGYTMTKSSLHFTVDRPLAESVVQNLIAVRLEEIRKALQLRAASL
jgi:hypothetical protein